MKILTATSQGQGQRASDYNWCVEGELVTVAAMVCDRDKQEGPDGGCGCGRSFAGLNSHKGTTTALVRDVDGYTPADLLEAIRSYREQAGWTRAAIDAEAAQIAEIAARHPAGTILERRLAVVQARSA